MKIGSLVLATAQGLGYLAKEFYDNKVVTDVLIVRHDSRETHGDWYPGAEIVSGRALNTRTVHNFCTSMDVMLFFETPFNWTLLDLCRRKGVPTALMPMYECMPAVLPVMPDAFLCPSLLDLEYYLSGEPASNRDINPFGKCVGVNNTVATFTPIPVGMPWRERTVAKKFFHNAGNLGLRNRNGTGEFIEALQYVETEMEVLIRTQRALPWGVDKTAKNVNLKVEVGTFDREELWSWGDVFVFPEKFNGLSLPIQEAYASGLLVMASDRFPTNTYTPREPLIPIDGTQKAQVAGRCVEFDEAILSPRTIAATMDKWCGKDITELSRRGREWATRMSWEVLGPKYRSLLEGLCRK